MNKVFLIGNGYVCDYISELKDESKEYIGVCRSNKNNFDFNVKLDISKDNEKIAQLIQDVSQVVYLVPPQQHGDEDFILMNFMRSVNKNNISKIVYISTSGVYGDRNDQLVRETDEVNPNTSRAKRRVNAEKQIKNSSIDYVILRVPGIYGRGRLPLKRIDERTPLIRKDICKHTNLIHAKDLSKIILECTNNKNINKQIINVSDGSPIKTTDYYLHIYDELNIPYPDFIDYSQAEKIYDKKRLSFINESRILDTTLMERLFPSIIEFKDIRQGIKDSLKG